MRDNDFIITSSDQNYTFICCQLENKKIKPFFYKEKISELEKQPQNVLARSNFFPFGIARNDQYICVISHTRLACFNSKTYEYLGIVEECKTGVNSHQMLFDENDTDVLYICNTSNDSLTIFNFKTKENKYLLLKNNSFELVNSMNFNYDVYADDNYHFNSICQHKNSLFLLLSFKGKFSSKILEISKNNYQLINIIDHVGFFNHDLIATNNYLYTLSTQTGELIEYNRINTSIKKYKISAEFNFWWLRGMKKINNSIYVFIGKNLANNTNFPITIVREFDIESKKIISTNLLPLKGSTYQII